jgi:valyl-tRNA synthetase
MINWDPAAGTALSDEEVEYKDENGKLYYINYEVEIPGSSEKQHITIATQRPETIMGDTAVCVNPDDERYAHLKDAFAIVPLIDRKIPIIFDEYVDASFGTGALKVTPAHDINDYNLGLKHNLDVIDTLNPDGTLSAAAQIYIGEDRFKARRKIIAELQEKGFIQKEEAYQTRLGYSQRSGAVVEPRISTQWFLKMKELAEPALQVVLKGEIKIHPGDKFLATYKYWLENVKDWCISRQLWWGQQIPAWYDDKGNCIVAENKDEAIQKWRSLYGSSINAGEEMTLTQDEDVLDTWFSSWLWPIQVFNGITQPGNKDLRYYYPTSVLVTGQDIIFFWVARMIMAGMEFEKAIPFRDVYFTGMVRDKLGRKMSKSLGNSPDLLELIEQFGADAVRFGIMISSPAGNDLLFDTASLEQGRFFNNKMWNALKLVKMLEQKIGGAESTKEDFAVEWFQSRLSEATVLVNKLIAEFKLSEALKTIYSLVWDDFCSWYLEWIKPDADQQISQQVYDKTVDYFSELLHLLHPFMPFITEELYHLLDEKRKEDLCIRQYKTVVPPNPSVIEAGELLKQTITAVRDTKVKNQLKPKEEIKLFIQAEIPSRYSNILQILSRQVKATTAETVKEPVGAPLTMVVGTDKLFVQCDALAGSGSQKEQLQKDLDYQKGFLTTVEKKLSNERFVQNAKPEVIALERKKKADAEARIRAIEESLTQLN